MYKLPITEQVWQNAFMKCQRRRHNHTATAILFWHVSRQIRYVTGQVPWSIVTISCQYHHSRPQYTSIGGRESWLLLELQLQKRRRFGRRKTASRRRTTDGRASDDVIDGRRVIISRSFARCSCTGQQMSIQMTRSILQRVTKAMNDVTGHVSLSSSSRVTLWWFRWLLANKIIFSSTS